MATCPRGHESTTTDYCDQCGIPMASVMGAVPAPSISGPATAGSGFSGTLSAGSGASSSGPVAMDSAGGAVAAGSAGEACPVCGSPRDGRFCEVDGYDFVLAPPVSGIAPAGDGGPTTEERGVGTAGRAPGAPGAGMAGGAPGAGGVGAATPELVVAVDVDRRYFDVVVGMAGEDSGLLTFPRFVVERRFPLTGERALIGRTSRSRGIQPDIDLSGAPEDPGVSHAHALLLRQVDGWAVVDLGSANGTYVNDPRLGPIPPETPVPVKPGDRVFLGAWTCLTLRPTG